MSLWLKVGLRYIRTPPHCEVINSVKFKKKYKPVKVFCDKLLPTIIFTGVPHHRKQENHRQQYCIGLTCIGLISEFVFV